MSATGDLEPRQLWLVRNVWTVGYFSVIAVMLASLVAAVAWVRGAMAVVAIASGLAIATMLALLVATTTARRWHRRRVEQRRREIGDRVPGDSPVAWISTETWRRGERDRHGLYSGAEDRRPCVDDAEVAVVEARDMELAPVVEPPGGALVSPPSTPDERAATLRDPPLAHSLWIHCPSWPACCDRLATLVGHECEIDEAFREVLRDAHFLHAEIRHGWALRSEEEVRASAATSYDEDALDEGHALFHCRHCGRVYVASYHP
jgi:hypothetical protein